MIRLFCEESPALSILMAAVIIAGVNLPAEASVAERAGDWSTAAVVSTVVGADGTKTGFDPGPAGTTALGHLDQDGVIDLVVVYAGDEGAFAAVSLGDPRFRRGPRHDLERERQGLPPERPFSDQTTLYPLSIAADWAAVGDYNADGFYDVVFAARGSDLLEWLAGDGTGRLTAAGTIALEGAVTAFAGSDINRRDGLEDIVIGVDGPAGSAVLVFEGPEGALKWAPERHAMPAAVTSLATGWLDGELGKDLAVAAGDEVLLVSGRDRRLVLPREKRDTVRSAVVTGVELGEPVSDVAVGHFVGEVVEQQLAARLTTGAVKLVRFSDGGLEISDLGELPAGGVMISARAAGLRGHDFVVVDPELERLEIFHADETVKSGGSVLARVPAPRVPVVKAVPGRLNTDTRDDLVLIGADGSVAVATTKTRLALEVNSSDDTDDGICDGTHCSLREAINYANSLPAGSTITFLLGLGDWVIEPQSALPQWTQTGASSIDGSVGSFPIEGKVTITGASAGDAYGLSIHGANVSVSNLHIRGFERVGLALSGDGNHTAMGCLVGLDPTGAAADGNGKGGIGVYSAGNTVGGTGDGEGNVVSGNFGFGGALEGGGVEIDGDDALILGNVVGTDVGGTAKIANQPHGIYVDEALRVQIGSGITGGGNLISGNDNAGVFFEPNSDEGLVLGNVIGLDINETAEIGNLHCGMLVYGADPTIGGTTSNLGNVISGSQRLSGYTWSGTGIYVLSGSPLVIGNLIGTDGAGTSAVPNATNGVVVESIGVVIGGEATGAGNVISGNDWNGVAFEDASEGEVYGNLIGVAADGITPLGNAHSGIRAWSSSDIVIGSFGGQNTIAYNASVFGSISAGISVFNMTQGVTIGPNSIHDNHRSGDTRLGIDLGPDGVTANDPLDADTGPNGLQNFPEITAVDATSGTVSFSLHSSPNGVFQVLLYANSSCDSSGYGEGETYLGGAFVATDANGDVDEQVDSLSIALGQFITATATDLDGNSSEFSLCFEVGSSADLIFADGFESGGTNEWSS